MLAFWYFVIRKDDDGSSGGTGTGVGGGGGINSDRPRQQSK